LLLLHEATQWHRREKQLHVTFCPFTETFSCDGALTETSLPRHILIHVLSCACNLNGWMSYAKPILR
jgi:hypothetical protein